MLNWKIGKMIRVTLVKSSVRKVPTVTIELKYEIGGFKNREKRESIKKNTTRRIYISLRINLPKMSHII